MKKHKHFIWFLLPLLLCVGCKRDSNNRNDVERQRISNSIDVIVVDGCEYVRYQGYKSGGLTHKGNCKNHTYKN